MNTIQEPLSNLRCFRCPQSSADCSPVEFSF